MIIKKNYYLLYLLRIKLNKNIFDFMNILHIDSKTLDI